MNNILNWLIMTFDFVLARIQRYAILAQDAAIRAGRVTEDFAVNGYRRIISLLEAIIFINLGMVAFLITSYLWGNKPLAVAVAILCAIATLVTWYLGYLIQMIIGEMLDKIPGLKISSKIKNPLSSLVTLSLLWSFVAFWIAAKGLGSITSDWFLIVFSLVVFLQIFIVYTESTKKYAGYIMFAAVWVILSQAVFPNYWDWILTKYNKHSQTARNDTLNTKNRLGSVVRVQGKFNLYKEDGKGGFIPYAPINIDGIDWLYMVDASESPKPYGPYNFVRVYEPAAKGELVSKIVWYRLDDGSVVNKLIIIPDKAEIIPSKDGKVWYVRFLTDDFVVILDNLKKGQKYVFNGGIGGFLKWPGIKDGLPLEVPQGTVLINDRGNKNNLTLKYVKGGQITIGFLN